MKFSHVAWVGAFAFLTVGFAGMSSALAEEQTATKKPQAAAHAQQPAPKSPVAAPDKTPALTPQIAPAKKEVTTEIENEEREAGYGKTRGLLGPVTLGPTVGVALPHPVNLGLEGRYLDIAGFAFDYGFLPQITFSSVKAKINSYDFRARWFPFRGSFFLGAAYGKQKLSGNKTQTLTVSGIPVSADVSMDVDSTYLAPQIGWRWQWESGFVIGLDFGWQFVMSNSTALATNITDATVLANDEYQKIVKDVTDVGNDIGKTALPNITLFQIGYMF